MVIVIPLLLKKLLNGINLYNMKYLVVVFYFLTFLLFSQTRNIDPVLSTAIIVSKSAESSSQKRIKENQKRIQTLQTAINLKVQQYKALNQEAQEALSRVNAVITDSKKLTEIGIIGNDIIDYQKEILELASDDPKLIALALKSQKESTNRIRELSSDVAISLRGGTTILMSANDRREILNRVLTILRQVRGLSFGVLRRFKWANDANFLKKLLQEYDLGALYLKLDRANIINNSLPGNSQSIPRNNNQNSSFSSLDTDTNEIPIIENVVPPRWTFVHNFEIEQDFYNNFLTQNQYDNVFLYIISNGLSLDSYSTEPVISLRFKDNENNIIEKTIDEIIDELP